MPWGRDILGHQEVIKMGKAKKTGAPSERKGIKFKRLSTDAKIPTKATHLSAGFDFYSIDNYVIPPWENCLVDTGITVQNTPSGFFLKLESRSGLCLKEKIYLQGGVIDPDYNKASIKAILFNFNSTAYEIEKGQKVCQGIFLKTFGGQIQSVRTLSKTKRGARGFGSSDKHE